MNPMEFVQIIEEELKARKIPKGKFYDESGVSSATMSQWRKGQYAPSPENIKRIESYLGITFSIVPSGKFTTQTAETNKKSSFPSGNELSAIKSTFIEKLPYLDDEIVVQLNSLVDSIIARKESETL